MEICENQVQSEIKISMSHLRFIAILSFVSLLYPALSFQQLFILPSYWPEKRFEHGTHTTLLVFYS